MASPVARGRVHTIAGVSARSFANLNTQYLAVERGRRHEGIQMTRLFSHRLRMPLFRDGPRRLPLVAAATGACLIAGACALAGAAPQSHASPASGTLPAA